MITPAQAEEIILSRNIAGKTEIIAFEKALHRVTAQPLITKENIPPFHRVMMDGIGVRFSDVMRGNARFRRIGIQAAGDEPTLALGENECIEIMTGAACPPDVDVVIPYEDLEQDDDVFILRERKAYQAGQNIQRSGIEARAGDVLLEAGQCVDAATIGLAASLGITEIAVRSKLRILIWTTGDELVPPESQPRPWQIRASNGYALRALLRLSSSDCDIHHSGDNWEATRMAISEKLRAYDVIIFTGGVSKGKFDLLPDALKENGIQEHFHRIAQKPGKPMWFGSNERTVVFGLPGNPVSCFMCMVRYVLPWLSAQQGLSQRHVKMKWKVPVNKATSLTHYIPVKCDWQNLEIAPVSYRGSGDFSALVHADAFAEFPSAANELAIGDESTCYMIPGRYFSNL